jgi:CMP-N-acetylneuraminic acid synthetase
MKYVALICARGGSKGLPGKNTRLLADVPLIGWSIKAAQQTERISRVIVSTDSHNIAQVAREYGAEVPFIRPEELAQDDSSEWLVWRHALDYLAEHGSGTIDGLVSLPPTAPLRAVADIDKCLDEFEKGEVDVVITVSDAYRSPYFNMVVNYKGYASLVIPPDIKIVRRQDAPVVYDMTTVAYVAHPKFINEKDGIFEGRVRSVYVPLERAIDIDTLLDFKMAECLIKTKINNENNENN